MVEPQKSGKPKKVKRQRPASDSPPLERKQLPADRGLAGWANWCEVELEKNQAAVNGLKKRYDKFISRGGNKDELFGELLSKLPDGSDETLMEPLERMFAGESKQFIS